MAIRQCTRSSIASQKSSKTMSTTTALCRSLRSGSWRSGLRRSRWLSTTPSEHSISAEIDVYPYDRLSPGLESLVNEYCRKPPTSTTLQMLMKTGRGELLGKSYKTEAFMGRMGQRLATHRILVQFASFLRKELPIRLAHRIKDLDTVPSLRDIRTIQDAKGIYVESFLELIHWPPIATTADEEDFATMLERLYTKHSSLLVQTAKGAFEHRKQVLLDAQIDPSDPDAFVEAIQSMEYCNEFLDRFYMSRIGIRVLAGQYLALRERPRDDYVGMICLQTSPSEIVQRASRDVMGICRQKYGRTPTLQLEGRLDLTFPYIPTYLHYILLELLKNAMRATVEAHMDKDDLPPVIVIIADGTENEDVVIKIADQGGGIARSRIDQIWSYLYTTADSSLQEAIFAGKDHSKVSPIAGLGYGLPISRSYCRYFGGEISLMSMDGFGTDVFVHLKRLGDSKEPIIV
jgi:pyruvate dehydrogenase kinase 2/3/4